jgi:hypothetical protein
MNYTSYIRMISIESRTDIQNDVIAHLQNPVVQYQRLPMPHMSGIAHDAVDQTAKTPGQLGYR